MHCKDAACSFDGADSRPKLEECKSVMYIRNQERLGYSIVRIDGCDIKNGYRCDFGVHLKKRNEHLFVELKGSDVKHAVSQLAATLHYYGANGDAAVKCFIISSNNPLSSSQSQMAKFKFKKEFGVSLQIERTGYEYFYS